MTRDSSIHSEEKKGVCGLINKNTVILIDTMPEPPRRFTNLEKRGVAPIEELNKKVNTIVVKSYL